MLSPQGVLPGFEVDPYADLTYREKAALIREEYEDSRDNDNVFVLRCAWEFDGLRGVVSVEVYGQLLAWAVGATAFETWRRRRAEWQKNRGRFGVFRGSDEVMEYRQNRDGAGPPR